MALYPFQWVRSLPASLVSGQDWGGLLPRILLLSLPCLYFLSGCLAYTSCLATGQSVFILNIIDRIQTIVPHHPITMLTPQGRVLINYPLTMLTPQGKVLMNYPLPVLTSQGRMLNSLTHIKALYLAMECHENLIPACVVPGVNTYCCDCFCGRETFSKGKPNHVTSPAWYREHHRRVVGRNRRAWRCHTLWILSRITPPSHHSAVLCARLQSNHPSIIRWYCLRQAGSIMRQG